MTKTKLIFIGLAAALVGFLFAGSASAQGQSMTVSPSAVEAPGTYDFEISAEGFTLPSVNFATCSTGDGEQLTGAAGLMQHCGGFGAAVDIAADGTYSATVTGVEVTDAGVTFLLFELREGGEAASASVNIGEAMADEMPATGVNTSLLVIIGAGIALAGVMVFGLSRRLRTL